MVLHKIGPQPRSRPHVFWNTHERGRKKSRGGLPEQMEPRLSFFQCPDFEFMSERAELSSCEKIFEFLCRRRYAPHSLVATDAGEHDMIPLRGQAHLDLPGSAAIVAGSRHKAAARRFGSWFGLVFFFQILSTDIDVPAGAAALFFHFGEI